MHESKECLHREELQEAMVLGATQLDAHGFFFRTVATLKLAGLRTAKANKKHEVIMIIMIYDRFMIDKTSEVLSLLWLILIYNDNKPNIS